MMIERVYPRAWLLPLLAFCLPLLLLPAAGGTLGFAGCVAAAAAVSILFLPRMAAFAAIFLLYSNAAVVSQRWIPYPQLVAASVVLPLIIPILHYFSARREEFRVDTVFLLMLVFLALQLASTYAALDFKIAAARILSFASEGILLYFLVVNAVRHRHDLRSAIAATLLAGALLGTLSLVQAVTHNYTQQFGGLAQRDLALDESAPAGGPGPLSGVRTSDRAAGPVGDPNRYAQILLVILPLGVYRFLYDRSLVRKAITAFACLMVLCGVLLSYSRGAFLTVAFMIFILVLMGAIPLSRVLIGGVLLAASIPFVAPNYYQRIQTLLGAQGLVASDANADTDRVLQGRATEMLAALHVMMDYPVLGVGPGQYMPFYSEKYQLDPNNAMRQVARERRAHSLYLEMGAETGVIGLVLFVSMPLVLLGRLWRVRLRLARSRPAAANLAAAFSFSIIAYLTTGLFLHLAFERYYWFLLALSAAALQLIQEESKKTNETP